MDKHKKELYIKVVFYTLISTFVDSFVVYQSFIKNIAWIQVMQEEIFKEVWRFYQITQELE